MNNQGHLVALRAPGISYLSGYCVPGSLKVML